MKKFDEFVLHRASVPVTFSQCCRYKERLLAWCQHLARCCGALHAPPGRSAPAPSSNTVHLSRADCSVPLVSFVFLPFTFFLFLLFPESQGHQPRTWCGGSGCAANSQVSQQPFCTTSAQVPTRPRVTLLMNLCQEACLADLRLCLPSSSPVKDPRERFLAPGALVYGSEGPGWQRSVGTCVWR